MPADRVGTLVANRYRIVAPLGEGGIGQVFLAEDVLLRMRVALKILRAELAQEPEIVARFEREADAMLALAHDHIVHALNFGRTPEGELCMVMEFVEGETLRSVLRRIRPLPLHGAMDIAQQIGSGLAHAHSLGIVHRDLKPENVMVSWHPDGRPHCKILDFGMARMLCSSYVGEPPLTRKGAVFGTPEYMAPEQALAQPVDSRCDQYAFGVMIYEMLAGRRPFQASTPLDVLQLQIHQPPPPLTELAPTVPPEIAAIVTKMLAKRPNDRFETVQAATQALLAAFQHFSRSTAVQPIAPSPETSGRTSVPSSAPSLRKWWQRWMTSRHT